MASNTPAAKRPPTTRPVDEEIAREEIEAFYARRLAEAKEQLTAAQKAYDLVEGETTAALAAFRSGEQLPERDIPWIALKAGGLLETTNARADEVRSRFEDRDAVGFVPDPDLAAADRQAAARNAATARWLRATGYRVPRPTGQL